MFKKLLFYLIVGFVAMKIFSVYSPVEVIPVKYAEIEDTLAGDFLVLRVEEAVTTAVRGTFRPVKSQGERVAKNATIGYLETLGGTSLEKKASLPLKAPCAGVLSYETDGLENICDPKMWAQLDLSKLDEQIIQTFFCANTSENNPTSQGNYEAGQSIFKIVDNLAPCYFYFIGGGAYPEKVQKGAPISVRLENNKEKLFRGTVADVYRDTGKYCLLLKISGGEISEQGRREKGELIISNYSGIVLPEGAVLYRDNHYGVFLFQKGKAVWREVERLAQFGGKVVLSGLKADEWVIAKPEKVRDGQWVRRINN